MKGKCHIVTNIATVVFLNESARALSSVFTGGASVYNHIRDCIKWRPAIETSSSIGNFAITAISFLICASLFILGSLLPDIDQEKSTIGKICHIPVRHRTWTHTIWVVLVFALISAVLPCVFWLTFGYTLHIFYDSLSKGGICWFYPISQYKTWTSGAQVKKNHKFYLYRTGETSEIITTMLVVLMGASMLIYNITLTVKTSGWASLAAQLFAVNRE